MQEACKIVAPKLGISWHTAPAVGSDGPSRKQGN